jgi:hypothetical protein
VNRRDGTTVPAPLVWLVCEAQWISVTALPYLRREVGAHEGEDVVVGAPRVVRAPHEATQLPARAVHGGGHGAVCQSWGRHRLYSDHSSRGGKVLAIVDTRQPSHGGIIRMRTLNLVA